MSSSRDLQKLEVFLLIAKFGILSSNQGWAAFAWRGGLQGPHVLAPFMAPFTGSWGGLPRVRQVGPGY